MRTIATLLVLAATASAQDVFLGAQSCSTSGCHGGGAGHDQYIIWSKKDVHTKAHSVLTSTRSQRMAETLKIADASKSARCTVCHSPMEALPPARLAKDVKPDKGVSCESCHGPAESYHRYHTRTDLTHEQRLAGGLRMLDDNYHRANACIACHHNLDTELTKAGHPEMFFDLDGQSAAQPPHWVDKGEWLGPQAWLTGQAAALREMSWQLKTKPNPELGHRAKATAWLLRTASGASGLPGGDDFSTMQTAADKLARDASREKWTAAKTSETLRKLSALTPDFRDSKIEPGELRRRAEVLSIAIDRLWAAMKKDGKAVSDPVDKALALAAEQARAQLIFDRSKFAAALQQIEVALELMPKP